MSRLKSAARRRITSDHWLVRCHRVVSPNCSRRTDAGGVDLVVVHGISLPPGTFGGGFVGQLFTNTLDTAAHESFESLRGVRVSAHVFIDRQGRVTQFVPFDLRAWHAGESSWRGRPACNDWSVGIELEGTDTRSYTVRQYAALAGVILALFDHYPRLARDTIVGHAEVAPGRKTDPGPAFDWPRLYRLLGA